MKKKTTNPSVPVEIETKIQQLNELLSTASDLYSEIIDWYDEELKTYDSSANALDELYDPSSGDAVTEISYNAIMDGLCILQTFNETYNEEN